LSRADQLKLRLEEEMKDLEIDQIEEIDEEIANQEEVVEKLSK
jgi:hypothetical protein